MIEDEAGFCWWSCPTAKVIPCFSFMFKNSLVWLFVMYSDAVGVNML